MNAIAEFLLTWLGCWAVSMAGYGALLLGLDVLLDTWDARRQHRAALQRIDDEAERSVQRIGTAFLIAQQLIREEAIRGRAGRP